MMKIQNSIEPIEDVTRTIIQTIYDIWASFVSHIPYFAASILIIVLTWLVIRLIESIGIRFFTKSSLRTSLKELIIRLLKIGMWIIGLLIAAMIAFPGLTPVKALGGLGIASLAIGFAFKDIFENFFAGILLLWRYPFENGDYINCEDIEGCIEKTNIRMTLIRKTSGVLVVVPNSFLFKHPVDILTNRVKRRVQIITSVAYGENLNDAIKVISDVMTKCSTVIQDQEVQVLATKFGSSSMDIEVTWWTGPRPVDVRKSKGEVIVEIKDALDNEGIEIPFPQRDIHFRRGLSVEMSSNDEKE